MYVCLCGNLQYIGKSVDYSANPTELGILTYVQTEFKSISIQTSTTKQPVHELATMANTQSRSHSGLNGNKHGQFLNYLLTSLSLTKAS